MDMRVKDEIHSTENQVYEAEDEITDEEIYRNAMPNSPSQFDWILKLVTLLRYIYRNETCFIIGNIPIIPPRTQAGQAPYGFKYICPDVAVFKGVHIPEPYPDPFGSWRMRLPNRPAPNVVIEIASDKTWGQDVKSDQKPAKYERLGVKEYFACDPDGIWKGYKHNLLGWRYQNGQRLELFSNEDGKIWSEQLNSDLQVKDRKILLYDEDGNLRKSEVEVNNEMLANLDSQLLAKLHEIADKDAVIKALEAELRKLRGNN